MVEEESKDCESSNLSGFEETGSMSSADNAKSVNLSDIKSEYMSEYWEQKRGEVAAVDVLIGTEKLFD